MSKFKVGDRVCSEHSRQFHRIHRPGTVVGISGTGSRKRYMVQLDGDDTPPGGISAQRLMLIDDIYRWHHADRIRYAEWLAVNEPSRVLPLVSNPATTTTQVTAEDLEHVQVLPTALLAAIARGDIDAVALARQELDNRGLDTNGKWVGWKR
jgi:hypothetical protein